MTSRLLAVSVISLVCLPLAAQAQQQMMNQQPMAQQPMMAQPAPVPVPVAPGPAPAPSVGVADYIVPVGTGVLIGAVGLPMVYPVVAPAVGAAATTLGSGALSLAGTAGQAATTVGSAALSVAPAVGGIAAAAGSAALDFAAVAGGAVSGAGATVSNAYLAASPVVKTATGAAIGGLVGWRYSGTKAK